MNSFSKLNAGTGETVRNFFWRNAQIFCKGAVSLGILFIAARHMTPDVFGLFNYLLAVAALFTIFCDFGISTAVSKYTAEYKTADPEKINKIVYTVSLLVAGVSLIVLVCLVLPGRILFRENYRYVLLFIPYLVLTPLAGVLDGIYRGLKEFRKLAVLSSAAGLAAFAISITLIRQFKLTGAILSLNVLALLSVLALLVFRKETRFKFDRNILKNISSYAFLIGLANIAYFMYTKVDMLIMKQFGYLVEIGYYGIIDTVFVVITIPALILGQVTGPDTTKHITLRDYSLVKNRFLKYFLYTFLFSVPLALMIYFILSASLRLFLPQYCTPEFLLVLKILLLLMPLKLCGIVSTNGFITPGGFVKILTIWTFIGGILNIVLDYICINFFGFIGVFLVTLIVHSFVIIVENLIFYRMIIGKSAV